MRDLGKDLCDSTLAPPIRALVVYGANPVVSMPNQGRVRDGLRRDDLFTVVHDLFVTDTALFADYVLPATSQIEHLDLCPRGAICTWRSIARPFRRVARPCRIRSCSAGSPRHSGGPNPGCSKATSRCCAGPSRAAIPGSRASVRAVVGRGLRAPGETRGLAAVCRGTLPHGVRQGRALFFRAGSTGPRSVVARRHRDRPGPAAHLRETLHFLNSGTATWSGIAGAAAISSSSCTPWMPSAVACTTATPSA